MFGHHHHHHHYNPYMNREMASDMWIQRNIPGGLNKIIETKSIQQNLFEISSAQYNIFSNLYHSLNSVLQFR
ncbi:unnamed protein product [Rotaria socialis]|uniref:Uncharacterized protein n=1 Tax=Rotaria socialis TaxID=392032 RepID=A0A821HN34_9BILA|nr:unnamed protein product [Rotaria socialis]